MVSLASLDACAVPVFTCVSFGRISFTPATSCSGETPDFAEMRIWSSWPTLSKRLCAVGRSKPASVAPPIEDTAP